MNYINLIGNLGPLTTQPQVAKKKALTRSPRKKEDKKKEIKTITWCGCGNHPINPKKDPYTQHNNWMAQFHPQTESRRTDIRSTQGIKRKAPFVPTYDFSGEEFEITNNELQQFKK
tara:strand:+ start:1534 stop:1881 length:348 start_codon:yes stop_codon:yes gene_type:complete